MVFGDAELVETWWKIAHLRLLLHGRRVVTAVQGVRRSARLSPSLCSCLWQGLTIIRLSLLCISNQTVCKKCIIAMSCLFATTFTVVHLQQLERFWPTTQARQSTTSHCSQQMIHPFPRSRANWIASQWLAGHDSRNTSGKAIQQLKNFLLSLIGIGTSNLMHRWLLLRGRWDRTVSQLWGDVVCMVWQLLEDVGFVNVKAEDKTDLFVRMLKKELKRLTDIHDDFVKVSLWLCVVLFSAVTSRIYYVILCFLNC